jgi:hypothetical protein
VSHLTFDESLTMAYSVRPLSRNVTIVDVSYDGTLEQDFLFTSDRHWDNPDTDQVMQKRHMIQAVERDAGIFDLGDFFCAMQARDDKRSQKSKLKIEHKVDDYHDALVNTGIKFFRPYASHIIRIARGNHETSVLRKHETDLTKRLVEGLNTETDCEIHLGGYTGWIMFSFKDINSEKTELIKLWYTHGWGGGGPVTKGVIQTNRRAVYIPDATIIMSGHIHEEWQVPLTRLRLDNRGRPSRDEQLHLQIPSYKDEYQDGEYGYHVESGRPPKPVGAIWLTFSKARKQPLTYDVKRAR